MRFILSAIVLVVGVQQVSFCQTDGETRLLTLEEAIRVAQSDGSSAKIAESVYYNRYWQYQGTRASYLPQVSLNMTAPGFQRSISAINQDDGTRLFVSQSQAFSSASLDIAQTIPWTGGSIFLSSGLNRIDLFGDIGSNQWQSTPLAIRFQQPLFQYNPHKWIRRQNELQSRIVERRYREDLEDIAIEVTGQFFDLYIAEVNLANAKFNVSINDSIFTISQGRYNVGTIAENELLQSELELLEAQNQLAGAKLAYERAEHNLRITLGWPHSIFIKIIPPVQTHSLSIDPQFALMQAQKNRSDVLSFENQRLVVQRDIDAAKSRARPSADLTATFGYNQSADNLSDAYKDLLDQEFFNVNIQFPLLQWGKGKAEIRADEAEEQRVENDLIKKEETLTRDVYFHVQEFLQLQHQRLLAAKADTISIRRFAVAKNRYLIGKIDITDLFNAQKAKDSARQAYIETLRNYWELYYRLRRLTLYDFEAGKPIGRKND